MNVIRKENILRIILGRKRNDVGGYEINSNRRFITVLNGSNIVATLKCQKSLRWAGDTYEKPWNKLYGQLRHGDLINVDREDALNIIVGGPS